MAIGSFGWFGIYSAAFLLGIAHSLEPGHGKTVVAAYLVGSKGRAIDAVILGLTVTFTHSFSIIVLGIIAKVSSKYYSEQQIHGWMGIVASLIILGIGLWMLRARWAGLRDPSRAHHHFHLFGGHSHGHSHAPVQFAAAHAHGAGELHVHDHGDGVHDHDHDHLHLHDHVHLHDHAHPHPHPHPHEHAHPHDHAHDHVHPHEHPHPHEHADPQAAGHHHHSPASPGNKQLGLTGLILLGVSGGIVPCPAALAILLASASVGDLGKGLALVVVFSIGLALSLVSIGMVIVSGVRGAGKFIDTEKYAPRVAFASAVIVTAVGAVTFWSSLSHLNLI
ncbi:sulfite exporter TauE/SafE family protein [Geomonas sp.]|uniref:HoxN/HupN/NixA family nickel/cobalt transporter n=1 Tax=Geomonas sp. TaxID=2651584 RepID=UPI002B494DA8|nr:sulfite exporter TauE/SafE family protein [Geomonas sp.]HJV34015.1 sulfite exporter TauE/SafE family protein [Geomonas sp.]